MENKIPNIIHFIFGLEKNYGGIPFSIFHFIAIRSSFEINRPKKIYLYYKYEPNGVWWERAKEFVEPVQVSVPRQIFGNKLYTCAHKADVLRLIILFKYGGIYLDIDTICVKPFAPLFKYDLVLGRENLYGIEYGLCNAVIMASKKNAFIGYWLSSYVSFRSKGKDKYWSEHSVAVPLRLAKLFPNLVHIEPESSFFYPSYTEKDLKMLFEECLVFSNAYSFHLWESLSYDKYLSKLNKSNIKSRKTSYNNLARKFL